MRHSRSVFKVTSNFFPIITTLRDKKTSTDLAIRPLSFQITQYCADYYSRTIHCLRPIGLYKSIACTGYTATIIVPMKWIRLPRVVLPYFLFVFGQLFLTCTNCECYWTDKPCYFVRNVICRFSLLARTHGRAVEYKLFRFCPRLETWINVLSISWIHYATRNCMECTFLSFFGWTRRYMDDIGA